MTTHTQTHRHHQTPHTQICMCCICIFQTSYWFRARYPVSIVWTLPSKLPLWLRLPKLDVETDNGRVWWCFCLRKWDKTQWFHFLRHITPMYTHTLNSRLCVFFLYRRISALKPKQSLAVAHAVLEGCDALLRDTKQTTTVLHCHGNQDDSGKMTQHYKSVSACVS